MQARACCLSAVEHKAVPSKPRHNGVVFYLLLALRSTGQHADETAQHATTACKDGDSPNRSVEHKLGFLVSEKTRKGLYLLIK